MNFNPALIQPSDARSGMMSVKDLEGLRKALEAGYGTDVSQLTGGAALRIQSLDMTMQSTIQSNEDFRLFNMLLKQGAGATVDEWTEQDSVGGFLGGSTNSEMGNIPNAVGDYNRRVGMVKFLMTQRQVSFVQTLQNTISDSQAVEQNNGALQLLTDAEYLSFSGDSAVVPTEFDGIEAQIRYGVAAGQVDPGNILDCRGQQLASVNLVNKAAAKVAGYGNFGRATNLFCSYNTQADFDTNLDPAYRVPLTGVSDGGLKLGAPVNGIRTSFGNISNDPDVFIPDSEMQQPFEVIYPAIAAAQASIAPSAVTPVALAAADVSSQFTAAQAGNYYYLVAGVNASGQSTGVVSAQVAIASGMGATLTIARSVGAQETGYAIYRSRQNGPGVVAGSVPGQGSDFRLVCRIPCAGATTVWTDLNQDIPGTSKAFLLPMRPGNSAVVWRQLLPMIKFPLYPTNQAVIPWAQMLFGYLRLSKRKQIAVFKNILSNNDVWRPHANS